MKVSLKKAFNLLDGRLSTEIGDVYEMLNFIFNTSFYTHELPEAMRKLMDLNPIWFSEGVYLLGAIKEEYDTDDFLELMRIINDNYSDTFIEITPINQELLK